MMASPFVFIFVFLFFGSNVLICLVIQMYCDLARMQVVLYTFSFLFVGHTIFLIAFFVGCVFDKVWLVEYVFLYVFFPSVIYDVLPFST